MALCSVWIKNDVLCSHLCYQQICELPVTDASLSYESVHSAEQWIFVMTTSLFFCFFNALRIRSSLRVLKHLRRCSNYSSRTPQEISINFLLDQFCLNFLFSFRCSDLTYKPIPNITVVLYKMRIEGFLKLS